MPSDFEFLDYESPPPPPPEIINTPDNNWIFWFFVGLTGLMALILAFG